MKVTYQIEAEVSENATKSDIKQYIDSLKSWGGCFHPSDPLFNGIRVTKIKRIES